MMIMRTKFKEITSSQFFVFLISLIMFFIAAGIGWEKLYHGFNFTDESWHMTESWRLVSGDRLFQDKCSGGCQIFCVNEYSHLQSGHPISVEDSKLI
jgi:hypothetical protein